MTFEPVLTRNQGNPEVHKVKGYRAAGGYQALEKAFRIRREEIIDEVKRPASAVAVVPVFRRASSGASCPTRRSGELLRL